MKRGGGEEAAAALSGGASGYTGPGVSGSGGAGRGFSGGGMGMGMGMTPGRVVVDKDDHLVRITDWWNGSAGVFRRAVLVAALNVLAAADRDHV